MHKNYMSMYKEKESNQLTNIDSKSLQNRFWKDTAVKKFPLLSLQ